LKTNKEEEHDNEKLQWRFDVNTFRLIGRDLITDRITAVFELVKNCYDANATKVTVDFHNTSGKSPDRTISIIDNGIGMSFADIKNKWMVVGTNSKRTSLYSSAPFNRKFVGEKGIGRFAVDKLGERLVIKTKEAESKRWLNVSINWDAYEAKERQATLDKQLSLFTDITNEYYYEDGIAADHGTELIISQVSEEWTEKDIERLYKELSRLISPFYPLNPPFDIFINSNEYKSYSNEKVKPDPVKFFSHQAEIDFDLSKGLQGNLVFNKKTGNIEVEWIDIMPFGPIKMRLYYFNESAKKRYNAAYKNDDTRIDGIKIYRDGVIATPFAEFEPETEKRRDILGIDKRRWRGTFEKIATREIIGVVDISKNNNPKIVDATNRQDFIDNPEYRQLKEFIIKQLSAFEDLKEYERSEKRSVVVQELSDAGKDVKQLERQLDKIEIGIADSPPQVKENVNLLKQQVQRLHTTITKNIDEQKKYQREVARKEKILYSIVSMQEYASLIAHAVRTSIAKVKHLGEFFKLNYPDPKYETYFIKYAGMIYDEMNTLVVVTDFMLSYASSDKHYEEFNVKSLLTDLLEESYKDVLKREGIKLEIDIRDDFIIDTNKKTFQDIFQNLVSNSIKALKNTDDKKIKCTGYLDTNNFVIYFSDNGSGIADRDKEWIFGLYNTRTAEQGGAGVGLYIVEKQVKALGGNIEVTDNEFKPTGATFKITIPFSKS